MIARLGNALMAAFAFAAGNFSYQWMQADPSWIAAVDRSVFQAVALLLFAGDLAMSAAGQTTEQVARMCSDRARGAL